MNKKGADQPAHPCILISAFIFRSLESLDLLRAKFRVKETALSLALSETPKTGFVASKPIITIGPFFTLNLF